MSRMTRKIRNWKRDRGWAERCKAAAAEEDAAKEEVERLMAEAVNYGFEPVIEFDMYTVLSAKVKWYERVIDSYYGLSLIVKNHKYGDETTFMGRAVDNEGDIEFWRGYNSRRDAAIVRGKMLEQEKANGTATPLLEGVL